MPTPKVVKQTVQKTEKTPVKKASKKSKLDTAKYVILSAVCIVLLFAIVAAVLYFTVFKPEESNDDISSITSSEVFAPDVDQIGDVESGAGITAKLFKVPDFTDKYYSSVGDIMVESEKSSDLFEFVIVDKAFSDKIAKGKVVSQSVAAGSEVERETKIELVISLGTKEIKMPNLMGMTEDEAKFELLKQGFIFENINPDKNADYTKYDSAADPGVVVEQSPAYGEVVNTDIAVIFYINSYVEEDFSQGTASGNR
jgi:hypothetical protein